MKKVLKNSKLVLSTEAKKEPPKPKVTWTYYRVHFDFLTRLCGSVPGNPNLVEPWQKSRMPTHKPPGGKSIEEVNEEIYNTLAEGAEEAERSELILQRNPNPGLTYGYYFKPTNGDGAERKGNLVVRTATLRAHMKDCAGQISRAEGKIEGERSFNVKVRNYCYHEERDYWTPILRPDGEVIYEADSKYDKPVHVNGPRGPQNGLKTIEFVYPASLSFVVKIYNEMVPMRDLEKLFMYGGTHGYGGERSDGEGRYEFSIEQIEAPARKGQKVPRETREREAARA